MARSDVVRAPMPSRLHDASLTPTTTSATSTTTSATTAAATHHQLSPMATRQRHTRTRHRLNATHARATGTVAKGVSQDFKWMKDTRWNWNNWRDVIFRADGSFLAPAEGCEREGNPKCQWSSDDEKVLPGLRPSPSPEPWP